MQSAVHSMRIARIL